MITVVDSCGSRKEPPATEGLRQAVSVWGRSPRASRAGVSICALRRLSGAVSQELRLTAASPQPAFAAAGPGRGRSQR